MKRAKVNSDQTFAIGRREFVLGATATFLLSPRLASTQMPTSEVPSNSENPQSSLMTSRGSDSCPTIISEKARTEHWCLVAAASTSPMLGFAYGLNGKGVPYEMPDVIIGTSAGSVVGSATAGGHLARLTRAFDFFGSLPKILAALVPTTTPNPSQVRARELCR